MAEDAGDDIRSRSVTLLSTSLSTAVSHAGAAADQSQLEQLAAAIEEATFDSQGAQTGNEYRNAVREKSLVLKKDNPDIVQQLISGKMTPKTFAQATAADLRSSSQAKADTALEEQNLQSSLGMVGPSPEQAVNEEQREGRAGQLGTAEDMLGEEGEFKSRAQPKVGKAMEGIEFETPGG